MTVAPRLAAQDRCGRRCFVDRRFESDQERLRHARSVDEAEQEGQPVVLRDEVPLRRGCRFATRAYRAWHERQHEWPE